MPLTRLDGRARAAETPGFLHSHKYTLLNQRIRQILSLVSILCSLAAIGEPDATAYYLANEGVMVVHGETSILFDPLFDQGYGRYELLPEERKSALIAGKTPYEDVDLIFISHYHGDHFSPREVLAYLRTNQTVVVYAPLQAVEAMHEVASIPDVPGFSRVVPIDLAYGDKPRLYATDGVVIGAVRIPHSGWPKSMLEVQNLAFRISLADSITVLHLGDADTKDAHYSQHADYWAERVIDLAFPPYWYFSSKNGQHVLENRLKPGHAVGIHVPLSMPREASARAAEYRNADLFTEPGESRQITSSH